MEQDNKIKLSYLDSDDDNIIVNNDSDLEEAYNHQSGKKSLKFKVSYEGKFPASLIIHLNRGG